MSRATEVCRVHAEAIFCRAEMVYASDLRRLSLRGARGDAAGDIGIGPIFPHSVFPQVA